MFPFPWPRNLLRKLFWNLNFFWMLLHANQKMVTVWYLQAFHSEVFLKWTFFFLCEKFHNSKLSMVKLCHLESTEFGLCMSTYKKEYGLEVWIIRLRLGRTHERLWKWLKVSLCTSWLGSHPNGRPSPLENLMDFQFPWDRRFGEISPRIIVSYTKQE